jgi:hypothetical protein
MAKKNDSKTYGCGLDVGTMNIVSARSDDGVVTTRRIRDAFLDLDKDAKKALKMSKADYYEPEWTDQIIVVGDSALRMANLFKQEVRRPLAKGVVSAGELDAQRVLSWIIGNVLGTPQVEKEHCFYSVPAEPIDLPGQDIVYHTEVFRKIIEEHGYTAHPMNEAMAIVYSQCADANFSGVSISYGSGMCNVALAYETMMGMSFSLARGGDWIDAAAANALGSTASRVCSIKEKGGFNLASPPKDNREAEAISLYIRHMIKYSLENIAKRFKTERNTFEISDPIPFIVSGGTTKAEGFMDIFHQEFDAVKKNFPIPVLDIRQAKDPMTAVAEGLLVLATQEHD